MRAKKVSKGKLHLPKHRLVKPGAWVLLFASIGAVLLLVSHAATPYVSIEAESSTNIVGAIVGPADSSASGTGSNYVQFKAPPTPPPTGTLTLPLRVSSDKRRFEDSAGNPFFVVGDTAWSLIAQLNINEVNQYLDNRKAKGVNTVLVNLIEHHFASNAPKNIAGVSPFTNVNNFTTTNEAYFAYADSVIQAAAQRNMVVLLAPAYAGNNGGTEGWWSEIKSTGQAGMLVYGQYLGQRYANYKNIVWLMGGDYVPASSDLVLYDKLAQGIKQYQPNALISSHTSNGVALATDAYNSYSWLSFDTIYRYGNSIPEAYDYAQDSYKNAPTRPVFWLEGFYEGEYGTSALTIRQQLYLPVMGGAIGAFIGNAPIWHFSAFGCCDDPGLPSWQTSMERQASLSLKYFGKLFNSRAWYSLIPDSTHTVLTAGAGTTTSSNYAAATRASNGNTVIVYTGAQKALTIDMTKVSGSSAHAWWFNPNNGTATDAGTSPTSGSKSFTPPSSGDWVLIIDDASLNLGAPGQ